MILSGAAFFGILGTIFLILLILRFNSDGVELLMGGTFLSITTSIVMFIGGK